MSAKKADNSFQNDKKRVLIVDDEASARSGLQELVEAWGYAAATAADGQLALKMIDSFQPHLIICDLVLPKMDGIRVLKAARQRTDATFIILTAQGSIDTAVEAIKEGAYDYLTKPIDMIRLKNLIARVSEKAEMLNEVKRLRQELRELGKFGALIGKSEPMKEVFKSIEIAAPTNASVLINGESGTGKELVAHGIHDMSTRRNGPFVAINCSAIPATLLESEIFGYEKGAFTGASRTREGCYELADGGTLFLDEIVEMAPDLQIKLLRVLEDGSFRRLGSQVERSADVRLVAASNMDFEKAIERGRLREDLYYRLNVFCLILPTLRERPEDIPLLTQFFINEFSRQNQRNISGADQEALICLQSHAWPGNVRELRNIVERAVIVAKGAVIRLVDLPEHLRRGFNKEELPTDAEMVVNLTKPLKKLEDQIICKALEMTRGNKTQAARRLGISVKTLHNKLARLQR